jgi:hypothetical protein
MGDVVPTRSIEKVATGLMLLRDGLGPYVEREINNALGTGRLAKADFEKHANDPDLFDRRISDWDVSPLLRVMFAVWNDAFRDLLGPGERSLVSELRTWRNRWAHQDRLTDDDADRILDSVERLLTAVGAGEAKRAKAIKDELRKERYAAEVPAAPAAAPNPTPRVRVVLPQEESLAPAAVAPTPAPHVGGGPAPAPKRGVAKRAALRPSDPAPERRTAKRPAERTAAKKATKRAATKGFAERATARPSEERPFKVVCWMKPEEAEVVAQAYATQADARATTGAGTEVEAVWYEPDHPDAVKYRAGVCMLRHRRSGDPRRMWIREEEALAVLAAYESAETVEYEHAQHGSGGRAVHHPDDAPEVVKYLANVMLTRYR